MISAASATRLVRETSAARLSSIGQFYEIVTRLATSPFRMTSTRMPLGQDGRFRIEGLVPGRRYTSRVVRQPGYVVGMLAADLAVAPGETRDPGDMSPVEAP
jgi:hypothetical protein